MESKHTQWSTNLPCLMSHNARAQTHTCGGVLACTGTSASTLASAATWGWIQETEKGVSWASLLGLCSRPLSFRGFSLPPCASYHPEIEWHTPMTWAIGGLPLWSVWIERWIMQRYHLLLDVCINLKGVFLALVSAVKHCDCPKTDKHFHRDTIRTHALIYSLMQSLSPSACCAREIRRAQQGLVASFPKVWATELPILRYPTSDPVSQYMKASPSHPVPLFFWFLKSTLGLVSRAAVWATFISLGPTTNRLALPAWGFFLFWDHMWVSEWSVHFTSYITWPIYIYTCSCQERQQILSVSKKTCWSTEIVPSSHPVQLQSSQDCRVLPSADGHSNHQFPCSVRPHLTWDRHFVSGTH